MIRRKGFSLIEAIVACVILSAAVMVLCGICTRSLSAVSLNSQYEKAWSLLDRQLEMIRYLGIDEFNELDERQGQFKDTEPSYHWKVETDQTDIEGLHEVSITVSWQSRRKEYKVSTTTRLNGSTSKLVAVQR